MRIHYRYDGRPRNTLCGLRIATDGKPRTKPVYRTLADGTRERVGEVHIDTTDRQPRKLPREMTWVAVPNRLLADALDAAGYAVECPHCLAEAATTIANVKARGTHS